MGICVFKTDDVRRCIEHTLNSKTWVLAYTESGTPNQPGLYFVHDQGVYLMSNARPKDFLDPPENTRNYAAYAAGCNPDKDPDWWNNSKDLVGGDDFGENVFVTEKHLKRCDEFEEFHVEVTEDTLESYFTKPRAKTANA